MTNGRDSVPIIEATNTDKMMVAFIVAELLINGDKNHVLLIPAEKY